MMKRSIQVQLSYPEGKAKALSFSYDGAQVSDRRLVGIFNNFGMKGTFHLNAPNLDRDGYITSKEAAALYAGHEIACHGMTHAFLTQLSAEQIIREIWEDRRALEQVAGYPVRGLAYAYGASSPRVINVLRELGIEYARTCNSTKRFPVPDDPLRLDPSCHHQDALELVDAFLNSAPDRLSLFYVWGHSYEFDRQQNWDLIEMFCEKTAGKSDVWYAAGIDLVRYLEAARQVVTGVEGTVMQNLSAIPLWYKNGDTLFCLKPGEILAP
jgi:peptidoglycan/xylan/chitin deacetylase (PgdA/CDA1 family)